MRSICFLVRRPACCPRYTRPSHSRTLLTLAIETSCDDTSVAILSKNASNKSTLHFHSKVTSDNREFGGIHPLMAQDSHQRSLSPLLARALPHLPPITPETANFNNAVAVRIHDPQYPEVHWKELRQKPDFLSVTRGPGMYNSLQTGLDTAKGLATAWGIPLVGVNHMQAHALTPRLVSSVNGSTAVNSPAFPFLSLLVSGGNTMLVHSTGLCEHKILAEQTDTPIGNALDHCARDILPKDVLPTSATVSYGPLLESFAFPNKEADYNYDPPKTQGILNQEKATEWGWAIRPPLSKNFPRKMEYSYSGLGAIVRRIAEAKPEMDETERRGLARETMKVAFEHLASRVLLAMDSMKADGQVIPGALVVSGGVAANRFLRHVLRSVLDVRGYEAVEVVFPPMELCTDNAAMIAWAGMEMFEAGYQTGTDATAIRKWSIDPASKDGGILGVGGWLRRK